MATSESELTSLQLGLAPSGSGTAGRKVRMVLLIQQPVGDLGVFRPLGRRGLAADQANAHRRRACLVFDESAFSLTPNVRPTWAPRGQPPTLAHPFNWKEASMAAAICYGVRGGGASWPSMSARASTTPTA